MFLIIFNVVLIGLFIWMAYDDDDKNCDLFGMFISFMSCLNIIAVLCLFVFTSLLTGGNSTGFSYHDHQIYENIEISTWPKSDNEIYAKLNTDNGKIKIFVVKDNGEMNFHNISTNVEFVFDDNENPKIVVERNVDKGGWFVWPFFQKEYVEDVKYSRTKKIILPKSHNMYFN